MLVERGEHIVPIGASERGKVDIDHRRCLLGGRAARRRPADRRCPWRRRRADSAHSSRSCQRRAQQTSCATGGASSRHETARTRSPRATTRAPAPICSSTVRACANDAMISDNSACDAMLTERPPRVCTNSPSGVRTHAPSPAAPGATASREFFLLDTFASVTAKPRCCRGHRVPLVERCAFAPRRAPQSPPRRHRRLCCLRVAIC
jgi:hypothetical protein